MKTLYEYSIAVTYIGHNIPSHSRWVKVHEYDDVSACNRASSYLKPNHLETLKILHKTVYKYSSL